MIDAIRDLLLAARCAGCGEPGAWFCCACRDSCDPVSQAGPLALRGSGTYEGPLREAIHELKYGGEPVLAEDLGAPVALEVARDLARGVVLAAIVPVPLHRSRAIARGDDQAMLLAEAVASRSGLPLRAALHRARAGTPQVELDRGARAKNVHKAFVAEAGALRGLRVALIDDVATNGATIVDGSAAARAASARAVRAYVVAVDA